MLCQTEGNSYLTVNVNEMLYKPPIKQLYRFINISRNFVITVFSNHSQITINISRNYSFSNFLLANNLNLVNYK